MIRLVSLRILDSYFRHRWLNLLPLVLMLGLAGASFYTAEPLYTSRGRLYVQKASLLPSLTQIPSDGISWQTPTQIAVNELQELLLTEAFPRSVIQKTALEPNMAGAPTQVQQTFDAFRKAMTIRTVGDNVIEITAQSKDPKLAQQLAIATIDSYSLWKLNGDKQESQVAQSFFRDVLPGYQADLQKAQDSLKSYLEAHPVPLRGERPAQEMIDVNQLQSTLDVANQRVANAIEKEESARLSQAQAESSVKQDYLLIDSPQLPLTPETSLKERLAIPAVIGVVGLMLTIVCIVGGALLDRSVRLALDVQNGLELTVLAIVPDVSRVVQPPVVTEPLRTLIPAPKPEPSISAPAVPQIQSKQRRGNQKALTAKQASSNHPELTDGTPALGDQTTA